MKLYPVFGSLIDVFVGEGWENWTRISIKRGRIFIVAGAPLDVNTLSEITRRLAKNGR